MALFWRTAIHPGLNAQFFRTPAGVAALVVTAAVLLWTLFAALKPLPGREFAIAAGPPGSAYVQVAKRYREILARDGVQLRLVTTNGAVENLERLRDPRAGVSAGFVQAGTTNERESPNLVSLGTVFYEPLWIFCRCATLDGLLRGRSIPRMSTGAVGSATRPLALKLLALNRVDTKKLQLSADAPEEEVGRLIAGEIDLAPILSAWDSPAVQKLLLAPDITLIPWRRADAYVALDPKFSKLILPEGVADLASNRPPTDVPLLASKASLIVRRDLHPALQYLLLRAAMEVHARPGIFQRANEFPAPEVVDLPISDDASHLYKSGPSILQRTLPFWAAELIQRLLIIVLPLAGIVYPLWTLLLRVYRWQVQRPIFRLYGELRLVERALQGSSDPEVRARMRSRMEELQRRAVELKMPVSFAEMGFNLRMHVRALNESPKRDA
jgi:TRAP-type uncharacterized transport system substrate-binding protein